MYFPRIANGGKLRFVGGLPTKLNSCRFGIAANIARQAIDRATTLIHLLREYTIRRMKILGLPTGVDPVNLVILNSRLKLRAKLPSQC